jgi:hypothetical protein
MEVSSADGDRIPDENLHVPRSEFMAVWTYAEMLQAERSARNVTDWYGAGVVVTCRWIARATVRPDGRSPRQARSPVTGTRRLAHPELIDHECLAAELLDMRQPVPTWLAKRPGWSSAIVATFNWVWRGTNGPPLTVPQPMEDEHDGGRAGR